MHEHGPLIEYWHVIRCQWAGEDSQPFPPLPDLPEEIRKQCQDRYLWQIRHNPDKERLRKTVYEAT